MSSHLRKFYAPLFTALILAIGSNAIATTGSRMCSQSATNESMSQELSQNFETLKTSESRLSIEEVETFSEELSTEISSLETDIETQTNNLTSKEKDYTDNYSWKQRVGAKLGFNSAAKEFQTTEIDPLKKEIKTLKDQLKKLNRLKNQVSEYVSDTKSDILFRDIKEMYAQVDKNSSISDNVYRSNYPSIVKSVMARPNPFLQLKIYGEILEKVKVFGNERRFDYEDLYAVTSFFFERNIKEKDYEKYIDKYMEIYKAFRGENYKLMFQTWTYNEKLSTESLRQIYDRVAAEGFKSAYDAPLTLAIALKGEAHYNTVIEAFRHIEDYERDYNLSVLLSKIFDKDFNIQKLESSMTKVAEVYEQNSEDRRIVSLAVYMEKNNFSPQEVQQGVEVFEQFKSVDSDKPAPLAISYLHFKNIAKKQMRAKGLEAAAIEENFNRIRENEEIDDVDSFFYYYTQAMIWPDNPILWFHPYGLLARVMVGEGLFGTHEMDMAEFTNELVHFDTIRDMDLENASEALREQVLENQELLSEIERPELENSEELEIERPELEISEAPEIEVEAPEIEVEVPEIEVDTSSFDSFDSGD